MVDPGDAHSDLPSRHSGGRVGGPFRSKGLDGVVGVRSPVRRVCGRTGSLLSVVRIHVRPPPFRPDEGSLGTWGSDQGDLGVTRSLRADGEDGRLPKFQQKSRVSAPDPTHLPLLFVR